MALAKELETLHASSRVRVIDRFDSTPGRGYSAWTRNDIDRIPQLAGLSPTRRDTMKAVSAVLPFRVNRYIVEELIDWYDIPHDPIFQLTFPQRGMLEPQDFDRVFRLVRSEAPRREIEPVAREIQATMNPHPAGQRELNVPHDDAGPIQGLQHKYKETVLFFPSAGQTCHAYCSYCFRWAQFVGSTDQRFASRESASLVRYIRKHPEITNVLITGGDPMVMKTSVLRRFVEPLLDPSLEQLESIRFGTKAPGYWPQRFVEDEDADDLMALFEEVRASERHLALMAHYSHPRELSTPVAERALARMQSAGATVRCQAPLIRHVNDDAAVWAELWRRQVRLGAVPYYMFVERDTGPRRYFEVGLARALEVFNDAYRQVSGLARTVRGPSMSATPGKILVDGVVELGGEPHFVLKLIQARNPEWVGRTFFARFDPDATWIDELEPPLGEDGFFYSCGPASAP
jgi:KamA family protein